MIVTYMSRNLGTEYRAAILEVFGTQHGTSLPKIRGREF